MAIRNRVTVVIAGVEYALAGQESVEHMEACARMVNERMSEIGRNSFQLSETMTAVLSACNIADEYLKLREKAKNILELETENARLKTENQRILRELARVQNSRVHENRGKQDPKGNG